MKDAKEPTCMDEWLQFYKEENEKLKLELQQLKESLSYSEADFRKAMEINKKLIDSFKNRSVEP